MAIAQGVMALAWDGLLRLPKELHPIRKLKLPWAMAVERYEAKYLRYCLIPEEMKGTRFYKSVKALTCLCNDYLGTNVLVDGGERLANEMMQEIFDPLYKEVIPPMSKVNVIVYKIRRLNHFIK